MKLKHNVPIPKAMAHLPFLDGYVKPWFVEGDDFRVMDNAKAFQSVHEGRCWVCGKMRKRYSAFVTGPLSMKQKISSEPPAHPACARYSMQVCPFIMLPKAQRREAGLPDELKQFPPGFVLDNPEEFWITIVRRFRTRLDPALGEVQIYKERDVHMRELWIKGVKQP